MSLPLPGTRIDLAGNLGTVRYVGSVENTSGIWLGIEWDDPTRGKHNGVHAGKRYFTCCVPNSGSFIRPTAHNLSYGVSFLRALLSKYIEQLHGSHSQETVLLGSSNGSIEVEAVHLDKIRRKLACVDKLRDVSLDRERVAEADSPGSINRTCPSIRNLDLSQSLIPNWDVVARIASELPLLQALALNHNRFSLPLNPTTMAAAFQRLEELQLNATLVAWDEMLGIVIYMPILRLLELGYNRLTLLETSRNVVTRNSLDGSTLQSLNLDSNECSDWPAVCNAVNVFPSLRRVLLSSNGIQSIPYPEKGQVLAQGLHHLSLSLNRLHVWIDIDALSRWCPELKTLALGGNPFVVDQAHAKNARHVAIALLPFLVVLDGAPISAKERVDCELFYLSYIARNGFHSTQLPEEYPRWQELCGKHGAPSIPTATNDTSDKLGSRLIHLKIYASSQPPNEPREILTSKEPTIIKVLPTMSLRMLRSRVAKMMRAGTRTPSLWVILDEGTSASNLGTEEDGQTLNWLGLDNNTQIIAVP